MTAHYHVFTSETPMSPEPADPVVSRARKDAAIKWAENNLRGQDYRITTDSGTVVHSVTNVPVDQEPCEHCGGLDEHTEKCPLHIAADRDEVVEELADTTETVADVDDAMPADDAKSKKFEIKDLKAKIAKLLAKAEKTDNEHERESFTAKAHDMMLRLGIDIAELEAAGEVKPEEIVQATFDYGTGYAMTRVQMGHHLAHGFGNLTTLQSGSTNHARLWVIGHKSDVAMFSQLLDSVHLQATSALHTWQRNSDRRGMSNYDKLVGSRSFLLGYANRCGKRLAERRVAAEGTASKGAELVLRSKQERVDDATKEMFPNAKEGRKNTARYSSLGLAAGDHAGKSADLGEKRIGDNAGELA